MLKSNRISFFAIIIFIITMVINSPVVAADTKSYPVGKMILSVYNVLFHEPTAIVHSADTLHPSSLRTVSGAPRIYGVVTSRYGMRWNPITHTYSFHKGIDIRGTIGLPIYAPASGTVAFVGWLNGYGNTIIIDHKNGFTSLLAHNQKNFVSIGDSVSRKTIIGTIGTTGNTTGPHMHVEISFNGKIINPSQFVSQQS